MMRKGNGTPTAVMIVVILIVAIGAYAYVSFSTQQRRNSPAVLSVTVPLVQAVGGKQTTIGFEITDSGGDAADQIVLSINSEAFGQVTLPAVSVGVGSYVADPATVQFKDLQNGQYTAYTTLSYHDTNGTHSIQGSFSFYLLPNVKVTGFAWEGASIVSAGHATIGRNDHTSFTFQVQSGSVSITYTHLSASATVPPTTEGLTLTPVTQALQDIGPQGTSSSYSFGITSSGTPQGQYPVTITVLADGMTATQYTVELTVAS